MRKLVHILLAICCSQFAIAQNNIKGYEYWFDNSYSSRQRIAVSGGRVYSLSTQLETGAILPGLHVAHVRFYDDSSRYSAVQSHYFYKLPPALAANSIVACQYWFDADYASAQTISTTPNSVVEITTMLNSSALLNGLHMAHVRFKDARGAWSETYSQMFYRLPAQSAVARNVVRFRYWFDNALDTKLVQSVAGQPVTQIVVAADANALPAGLHIFRISVQDDNGYWSQTHSQVFYKLPSQGVTGRNIVRYHYWFDNDLASGVMQPVSAQPLVQLAIAANTNALPSGMHFFRVRVQDDNGFWSGTQSEAFYVLPAAATIPNLIVAYRYWVDENDNQQTMVDMGTAVNPFQTPIQADLSTIAAGKHAIRFQFKDSRGQWSIVTTDSVTVQAFTQYTFTGNGNWSNAANWANNAIPPATVTDGKEVIIDHSEGGECIMDVPVTMAPGSKLTVKPGKRLRIAGNLIHQ